MLVLILERRRGELGRSPHNRWRAFVTNVPAGLPLLLDKAVACVRVVVDTVLLFQFLNVFKISFRMWAGDAIAERLICMQ